MKRLVLLLSMIAISTSLLAQASARRGFIGMTLGPSIPIGDFASKYSDNAGGANVGLNISLLNLGYTFGGNFGVTALWFGAAHEVETNGSAMEATWSYGGLMGGGLYTIPIANQLSFDLKAMAGFVSAKLDIDNFGNTSANGAGFDLGAAFRYHFADRWSLLVSADYFTAKPNFEGADMRISTFNLNAGIAYRFH
jgi:hypothetical protein